MITQERLKELFHYEKRTGVFTRIKTVSSNARAGDLAGYKGVDGRVILWVDRKMYKAHRLAWLYVYGEFPKGCIDHINHDNSDNRISNLRDVTQKENSKNASMSKNNTSGHTGVYWEKLISKWRAAIFSDGKRIHIGVFRHKKDAVAARKAAEIKYGFHPNHGAKNET